MAPKLGKSARLIALLEEAQKVAAEVPSQKPLSDEDKEFLKGMTEVLKDMDIGDVMAHFGCMVSKMKKDELDFKGSEDEGTEDEAGTTAADVAFINDDTDIEVASSEGEPDNSDSGSSSVDEDSDAEMDDPDYVPVDGGGRGFTLPDVNRLSV